MLRIYSLVGLKHILLNLYSFTQDQAANILKRNPHITDECDIKPINSPQKKEIISYNSEGNLRSKHAGHILHNPTVAGIIRSKAFAE